MGFKRNLIRKAVSQRFVVMGTPESPFSGVLVDYDYVYWRFENCRTVPSRSDQPIEELPGRIWVKHDCNPPPLLQEITLTARETLGREI